MKQMLDSIIPDVLPLTVRLEPVVNLTDEQFVEFCAMNEIVRIERTADGMLELRPLTCRRRRRKECGEQSLV